MEKIDFQGIPLAKITQEEIIDWVVQAAKGSDTRSCYGINAHSVNLAFVNPRYWEALQHADLIYCDGIAVYLGSKWLGTPIPAKLTTTDWYGPLTARCAEEDIPVFILGNAPCVAEEAAENLRKRYPGLTVCGVLDGFFEEKEIPAIIEAINGARPGLLWIGMGNPKQEIFVDTYRDQLNVPVILTCGAMMEIVAGRLGRPPAWITDNGMEWAYRLVTTPGRTWKRYLIGNVSFLIRLLRFRLQKRRHA